MFRFSVLTADAEGAGASPPTQRPDPDAPGESPGSDLAVEGIKRPASNQDAHGLPASAVNAESPIYYELGVRMWYVICSGFLFDVFI